MWQLGRQHDWEVVHVVHEFGDQPKPGSSEFVYSLLPCLSLLTYMDRSRHCPLAHELWTCARSSGLVLHLICLSHQSLFYTLGEVYCTLIGHLRRKDRRAIRNRGERFPGSTRAQFVEDLAFPSDHPHSRCHWHSRSLGNLHIQGHGPSSIHLSTQ